MRPDIAEMFAELDGYAEYAEAIERRAAWRQVHGSQTPEAVRARVSGLYARRRAAGQCVPCGAPSTKARCVACSAKHSAREKAARASLPIPRNQPRISAAHMHQRVQSDVVEASL